MTKGHGDDGGSVFVRLHSWPAACFVLVGIFSPLGERRAFAQAVTPGAPPPASPDAASDPEPSFRLPELVFHGFVSQGAFVSTENDYLGHSERGSVEFLEAALNVSTEVTDRLRVGAQLFTRDLGPIGNYVLSLDWAYLDYRWRDWLGLRAGRIKLPFGLYNEFSDIDSARLPILLPQSVYPITSRDFLLAHTGFSLYGSFQLGAPGGLDYQLYAGTMFILAEGGALDAGQLQLGEIDTKHVTGGQLFWRTPLAGLRAGASYLRTHIIFDLSVDPYTAAQLRMAGLVPPDFDGAFVYALRDIALLIGSIEYTRDDVTLAAEYSRWTYRVTSTIPDAYPESDQDSERFYGMVAYRISAWLEVGTYYSVLFPDADDRDGHGARFTEPHRGFQKDLAVSARFDVNDFWLWKLEAHYMDGTASLSDGEPADPDNLARRWGFFLAKTTVSF